MGGAGDGVKRLISRNFYPCRARGAGSSRVEGTGGRKKMRRGERWKTDSDAKERGKRGEKGVEKFAKLLFFLAESSPVVNLSPLP